MALAGSLRTCLHLLAGAPTPGHAAPSVSSGLLCYVLARSSSQLQTLASEGFSHSAASTASRSYAAVAEPAHPSNDPAARDGPRAHAPFLPAPEQRETAAASPAASQADARSGGWAADGRLSALWQAAVEAHKPAGLSPHPRPDVAGAPPWPAEAPPAAVLPAGGGPVTAQPVGTAQQRRLLRAALVGAPNAGKSTLTNALVGQKVCTACSCWCTRRHYVTRKAFRVCERAHGLSQRCAAFVREAAVLRILRCTPCSTLWHR